MINYIKEDIRVIFDKDPAAANIAEVIFCYPGLHALWTYRIAHKLYERGVPLIPRLMSHLAGIITGIEIHPGAKIGRRFFIDHGFGVVIGETAVIGDDVLIYQQVTLGGTGKEKEKRHPTLCSGVVAGAGAKILGNITIGENTKIGAGSVVVDDIPPNSTVIGIPGSIIQQELNDEYCDSIQNRIPNPIKCELDKLRAELEKIKTDFYGSK
ncbi:MAG: serine O-acetyltransferase [Heliobacteriaceae bacterium]|jgi:serine O-acetyltransferase|nr:serine O-acetyltransferase [Heliobacteriaceae bacterium]